MQPFLLSGDPDVLGPAITSSDHVSVLEGVVMAFTVTTDEPATLVIGGADASEVEFANTNRSTTHTLRWYRRGTKDYEAPDDANTDNVYEITITPTDYWGNVGSAQSFNITVTNAVTEDALFNNVVLLLGYEGTNGDSIHTISDESPAQHGAVSGGGVVSSSQFKFGSTALQASGVAAATFSNSTDWNLGTSQFTVETFFRVSTVSGQQYLVGKWSSTVGQAYWNLLLNGNLLIWNISENGGTTLHTDLSSTPTTISINTWYHAAVDYDGIKYRLFLNGVMVASSATARNLNSASTSEALGIGGEGDQLRNFLSGFMDETRITKGVSRYPSDTSFTVPTAAFPRTSGAAWTDPWLDALVSDGPTYTSAGFSGYTVRIVIPAALLSNGAAICRLVFDATTSDSGVTVGACYIGEQAATGNPYDMIPTTMRQVKVAGSSTWFQRGPGFGTPVSPIVVTDPIALGLAISGHTYVIAIWFNGTSDVPVNTNFMSGMASYYQYVNGGDDASVAASSSTYTPSPGELYYLSRIQVSTLALDQTLTAPFIDSSETFYRPSRVTNDPLWTYVCFLTGYEGTNLSTTVTDESTLGISTNGSHGTGSVNGSGTIVTATKKYGSSSFTFDGSTTITWADSDDFNFASGSFTVATWVNLNSTTGNQILVGQWSNASGNKGWMLYTSGTSLAFVVSTTGTDIINVASGGTIGTGSWHHIQVDFNGTKYRLYLDGVMVGSSTTLRTIHDSAANFALGGTGDTNALCLDGYLDETEVLKGAARNGSDTSFTPPSAAYLRN